MAFKGKISTGNKTCKNDHGWWGNLGKSLNLSRFLFIRNLQRKGHAQNSTQQITSTPYIGRRRYRTHRRAICALCLAEITLVRARKRKIGKRQRVRRYSKKAPASGPSRPEASSTKATKRLASSAPEEWRLPLPIKMAYTNTGKTQIQREKKTQTRREKNTDKDIVDKII